MVSLVMCRIALMKESFPVIQIQIQIQKNLQKTFLLKVLFDFLLTSVKFSYNLLHPCQKTSHSVIQILPQNLVFILNLACVHAAVNLHKIWLINRGNQDHFTSLLIFFKIPRMTWFFWNRGSMFSFLFHCIAVHSATSPEFWLLTNEEFTERGDPPKLETCSFCFRNITVLAI